MLRDRYYTKDELRSIAADLTSAEVIPVNMEIEAEHRVFSLAEIERLLRGSENIFLQDCGCRSQFHNCNRSLDTCLAVNVGPDYAERLSERNTHSVAIEEALSTLRRSHEEGLVHMAYVFKGEDKPQLICSCCTCCCHTLGGIVSRGITTQILTSKLIAEDDDQKCISCGRCAERCSLGARTMSGAWVEYDPARCFGCGLCVTTCPTRAITLVERSFG